jgi:hypothetical protein
MKIFKKILIIFKKIEDFDIPASADSFAILANITFPPVLSYNSLRDKVEYYTQKKLSRRDIPGGNLLNLRITGF